MGALPKGKYPKKGKNTIKNRKMKKIGILVLFGIATIMVSLSVSSNTLLMPIDGPPEYTIGNVSIMDLDKCVCPECAMIEQEVVGGQVQSIWLCDTCLCPYYMTEGPDPAGWYLFAEDICMTGTIKWKSLGWILAVNNMCTNFEAFGPQCNDINIPNTPDGNRVIVCGEYETA